MLDPNPNPVSRFIGYVKGFLGGSEACVLEGHLQLVVVDGSVRVLKASKDRSGVLHLSRERTFFQVED